MYKWFFIAISLAAPGMTMAGNRDVQCQVTCDPANVNDQETQRLLRNFAPLIAPPGTLTIIAKDWEDDRRFYAAWERIDEGWRGKEQGYRVLAGNGGGSGTGIGNEGGNTGGGSSGGWGGGVSPRVRCGSVNGLTTTCIIVLD